MNWVCGGLIGSAVTKHNNESANISPLLVKGRHMADLTAEEVREFFDYNPETGILTWIKCPSNKCSNKSRFINGPAGTSDNKGYLIVKVRGKIYKQHRVVWLWMTGAWPSKHLDHKDCNPSNNRWENLREATYRENRLNVRKCGRSGLKGASWSTAGQRWKSSIRVNGRRIHLGYFDAAQDAHLAYVEAAKEHYGEFARWS